MIVIGQSDQFARIEDVAEGYRPMVVWGNHQQGQRHCVVGTDNHLGGQLAAERLIASGATRIVFLGDTDPIEFAARYAGAREVAEKRGIEIHNLPTHLSQETMARDLSQHLPDLVASYDGIFAATDAIGVACLHALGHLGIAVPDKVRLIGFDDLPIAAQTNPPLTTIRQDIGAGARALVDLLMRRLAGEDTESLVMPPKLVARGTA